MPALFWLRSTAENCSLPQTSMEWLNRAELALADIHPLEKRLLQANATESVAIAATELNLEDEDFEDSDY
jgi:hypothetical protein